VIGMKKSDIHKLTVKDNFFYSLAMMPLTPCEYKCILTTLELGECNQAQISNKLGISRQNINKAVLRLIRYEILVKTKVEGRNSFFTVNTSFQFEGFDKDQLTLNL
jgi:predicted transcriptional regulator